MKKAGTAQNLLNNCANLFAVFFFAEQRTERSGKQNGKEFQYVRF